MNHKVLTTIALCSATLTLMTTAAPAFAAGVNSNNNVGVQVGTDNNANTSDHKDAEVPKAMEGFDFDFNKGTNGLKEIGTPGIVNATPFDGKVAQFAGESGYSVNFDKKVQDKIKKNISIETTFKYTGGITGEHAIFSNLSKNGGLGLSINNGSLVFTAHDGTKNIVAQKMLTGKKWIHAVGVVDTEKKTTSLYINGQLAAEQKNDGHLKFADGTETDHFVIGGNSTKDGKAEKMMAGKVKSARIYDQAITSAQAQKLSGIAHNGMEVSLQKFTTQLVGASDVVAGHIYSFNVHTRQDKVGDIDQLQYDVTFDPSKFEFVNADQTLGGNATTVQELTNYKTDAKDKRTIRITSSANFSTEGMRKYGETRLARIRLRAKTNIKQDTTTKISITSASAMIANQKVNTAFDTKQEQNVTIRVKDAADFNRDGIIGVGDISLAPDAQKAAIAQKAEIRPYKHVIVLTTDGGGNPWNPAGMYYAKDDKTLPKWTTDPAILAKRKNKYTMDLFNKQFAMSTTAESVQPAISAQNYSSMLHGLPWNQMDEDYRMTNGTAANDYFGDFDKKTPKYPSVFKVLNQANPHQGTAAFAEWKQILNGITEPDAGVDTNPSASLKSFDDVADYVGTDKFNDTSLIYMQSDYMDGQGHGKGWYNDNYWNQYAQYDGLFKKVMDKLEATGHSHDTLVIANSDHGGSMHSHGSDQYTKDPSNNNIFIGIGGETVNSGHRLKGGSNADISALILNALQVKQPASMTGKVFDSSAFLDQTELVKKNRQVESINLKNGQNKFDLQFKANGNRQIRTLDARIDLGGQTLDDVKGVNGAKVLRKTVENGILKLTLSFDKQPTDGMATVTLKKATTKAASANKATIKQAMLGTDKGVEVLPDITTDATAKKPTPAPAPSQPGTGSGSAVTTTPGSGSSSTVKPTKPAESTTNVGAEQETHKKPAKKNKLKGKIVYAQKKIGFYKKTKFTKKNRYKFFTAKTQSKWAQFKIVTKKGNRYQVKDINKGSKTYGKVGYITTSSKYVTPADYTKKPIKVKVLKTLSAYKSKTLKGKHSTYKRGTMLKIKKLVKSKGKLRLQLKNGKYITVDKHMIHAYFAHK